MSDAIEAQLFGVFGPTFHFAGVSPGNSASAQAFGQTSAPRAAALQGLELVRRLHRRGFVVGVMPPHRRPDFTLARRMGFTGSDAEVFRALVHEFPALLAACTAPSSAWVANAATVTPSMDALDNKVHFTPANLQAEVHRSLEWLTTGAVLRRWFADERVFAHHEPLPPALGLGDEGSANQARLAPTYGDRGLSLMVYGDSLLEPGLGPTGVVARQSREACLGVCRLHRLSSESVLMLRQNPKAIESGVFHNDLVMLSDLGLVLMHEAAFADVPAAIERLHRSYADRCGSSLTIDVVSEDELPLAEALRSYLFNGLLLTTGEGRRLLVVPELCQEHSTIDVIERWTKRGWIDDVEFVDLEQSLMGGGGPACLRLRVVLHPDELQAVSPGLWVNDAMLNALTEWVERNYLEELSPQALADERTINAAWRAFDALEAVLGAEL